jgi:hypothetical protein
MTQAVLKWLFRLCALQSVFKAAAMGQTKYKARVLTAFLYFCDMKHVMVNV